MSEDDTKAVSRLMDANFTIKEALNLLLNDSNKHCFKYVLDNLNKGKMIEDIFIDVGCKKYLKYFDSFIKYESFKTSLSLTINIVEKEDKQKKEWIKRLAYPLVLLFVSLFGIYVFGTYFFPTLLSMMDSFKVSSNGFAVFMQMIIILIKILIILLLVIGLILIYFIRPKHQTMGYIILSKIFKNSMLHQYLSNSFVLFYYECIKLGLSTKETLEILSSFKEKPMIVFMAYHIKTKLLEGNDFTTALSSPYIDDTLNRCMNVAVYTYNAKDMLEGYMELSEQRAMSQCKKISTIIQFVTYALIGVVIMFIYQILFLPLQIMSQI